MRFVHEVSSEVSDPLLDVRGASVRFGGINALTDVEMQVFAGEVVGLLGPNGAGKTTLFNVISGLQPPTAGRIWFDGVDVSSRATYKRARRGIARTFQRLEVFSTLSAFDNVAIAAELANGWTSHANPSVIAHELLERVGLADSAERQVGNLSTGHARLVELARALAARPKLLLLDEPSSGLDERESEAFGDLLVELAAGDGIAILLVEHDIPLVMRVSDRIYVLEFGEIIATGTPAEVQANPKVQAAYLGAANE